jgi:hypothetical protein
MTAAPAWLEAIAAGDFTALPEDLRWADTDRLAILIDGYGLAGSHARAAVLHRDVLDELRQTGTSTAPACDLWVALFFSWRRMRFVAGDRNDDVALLDLLCRLLRRRLQDLTPTERREIEVAMRASPWRTVR